MKKSINPSFNRTFMELKLCNEIFARYELLEF